MKFSDLKARVWDRLDEDPNDPDRYTAALLQQFTREAIEQWSLMGGGYVLSKTITLVANQLEYDLDETPISILEVRDETNDLLLAPLSSYEELYMTQGYGHNRRWRAVVSNRPTHYLLFSLKKIWLWPTLSSVSGETVTVHYRASVGDGVDLSVDDTVVPVVPPEYHDMLVDYVVGRCMLLGAKEDGIEVAKELIGRWVEGMEEIAAREAAKHQWCLTTNPMVR